MSRGVSALDRASGWVARHPWRFLIGYLLVTAALYQTAIHVPLWTPIPIRPTAVDAWIPLLPWTALPYLSYFALMPSFVWLVRAHEARGALLLAAAAVPLGNLTMNLLVPTEIVDPLTPARAGGWLLARIVAGDTPRAAFPSGHVALPVALALLAQRGRVRHGWVYVPWSLALGLSVLTTKQHYLPDVVGGVAWGLLGATAAWRLLRTA